MKPMHVFAIFSGMGLIVLCFIFVLLDQNLIRRSQESPIIGREDYLVYSALIGTIPNDITGTPILIDNELMVSSVFTDGGEGLVLSYKKIFPMASQETLQDFSIINSIKNQQLKSEFHLTDAYVLLDKPFANLPKGLQSQSKRVNELHTQYKGAKTILFFSRIGFNKSRDQALVLLGVTAEEGGALYAVLLDKTEGRWQVKKQHSLGTA